MVEVMEERRMATGGSLSPVGVDGAEHVVNCITGVSVKAGTSASSRSLSPSVKSMLSMESIAKDLYLHENSIPRDNNTEHSPKIHAVLFEGVMIEFI